MNQVNKRQISLIPLSVAPMLDWTDRHCRYFHRLLSPNTLLYTEMVTTGALIYGDRERYLEYNEEEHPVALQLGGSDPSDLAECAKMAEDHGYDEINLNCGCPSDRVQKGQFGAVLMESPDLVARSIERMANATTLPITVKCRIGIDEQDSFEFLDTFISTVMKTGCTHFIIHARKAWLKGLSPKENRTIPQINYSRAKDIKTKYPTLQISINGEIKTTKQAEEHLQTFDSVMIGREAYQNCLIRSYFFLLTAVLFLFFSTVTRANSGEIPADKKDVFSVSGYPIPRFVSLGREITNVRAGPGQQYPIRWVYKKKGLPVEVILEYDHWRKIRDHEGSEGWVYKTLLSGHRTALINAQAVVHAYDRSPVKFPDKAKVIMDLEPLSLVNVETCEDSVCFIEVSDLSGWIERKTLWGVYETEKFD